MSFKAKFVCHFIEENENGKIVNMRPSLDGSNSHLTKATPYGGFSIHLDKDSDHYNEFKEDVSYDFEISEIPVKAKKEATKQEPDKPSDTTDKKEDAPAQKKPPVNKTTSKK